MKHEYHVIYSVRYYPRFHLTAVCLVTYYCGYGAQLYIYLKIQVLRNCVSDNEGTTTLRNVRNCLHSRHNVTSQETRVSCVTAVRTSNLFLLLHAQEDWYVRLNYQDVLRSL
jgi:hypothetical protein